MTLADDLLPMVRELRGTIPGTLAGLRPHRVYLVEKSSSGTNAGDGTITTTETEIVEGDNQPPKVKQVNDEQRALGNLSGGALIIGPITPFYNGAGTTLSSLAGDDLTAQTDTLKVRVSGPLGNNYYRISEKRLDRSLRWMLTVEPVSEVPA